MPIRVRTIRRLILAAAVAGVLFMPVFASAVSWIPIVPCGSSDADLCTPCHLFQTGKNVIDLVLFGITGPIAAFMIVLAGGMMLLGGGNPIMFGRGRTLLTRTLIGVAIILVSWTATNFLIKSLGGGTGNDRWYEFSCPEGLRDISDIDTQFADVGAAFGVSAPAGVPPPSIGIQCPDRTTPLCGTAADLGVACKPCTNIRSLLGDDIFIKYARGPISAELLESIMIHESSCGRDLKSPAGAYGPMQLLPSTANQFKRECGIVEIDGNGNETFPTITGAWLMSEPNWEAGVCLAAAYLESLVGSCGADDRNLAANYNGANACATSISCSGLDSCGGGPMRRWECLWENREHTRCNAYRYGGGYAETRRYAPKVAACAESL